MHLYLLPASIDEKSGSSGETSMDPSDGRCLLTSIKEPFGAKSSLSVVLLCWFAVELPWTKI